ncbi:hypothetical protein [Streptosporangium sp. NPDC051022]|uniref:hypothetical protein n=1 Tax=Streptosporangium sp. NPDC051022 TaxID=3155752 RepID=UPI00343C0FC7
MSAASKITVLRGEHVTLAAAADAFLATARTATPNTHRAYASAIDRTIALLGRDRTLADVTDTEIGSALTELWGGRAPATWNRNRAAVTSWLLWCQTKKHWAAPSVPADAERRPARRPAAADICPHTGRARLGYDRARVLLEKHAGLDLHQLRHSAATHLGEAEVLLQLIMGKTRHKNPRTAMRYVKPGAEAIAKVTEVLAPRRRTH